MVSGTSKHLQQLLLHQMWLLALRGGLRCQSQSQVGIWHCVKTFCLVACVSRWDQLCLARQTSGNWKYKRLCGSWLEKDARRMIFINGKVYGEGGWDVEIGEKAKWLKWEKGEKNCWEVLYHKRSLCPWTLLVAMAGLRDQRSSDPFYRTSPSTLSTLIKHPACQKSEITWYREEKHHELMTKYPTIKSNS